MLRLPIQCIKSIFARSFNKIKHIALPVRGISTNFNDEIHEESIAILRERYPNLKIRDDPVVTKLDSSEFKSTILTKNVVAFVDMFRKYNHEIRVAGGAVRDLLLNKRPSDLDFATTATPQEMIEMFKAENVRISSKLGLAHGTVTPYIGEQEQCQVTSLRIDVKTDGRHAQVVFIKNWVLDAKRRDFTVNSMYLDVDGTVYDWFHGYDDLQKRRLVFVGDAEERIPEDYLRILRYFRFYGRIAEKPDNHDAATLAVIAKNISGLEEISGQRIWGELQKILRGNFGIDILRTMFDCGAAQHIGLSENVNYDELTRLQNAMKSSFENVAFHPVTILATQLNEPQDATNLQLRLRMQAYERDLAAFLAQNKHEYRDVDELLPYQKKIILSSAKVNHSTEHVLELLKYNDKLELHQKLLNSPMPCMPVGRSQLIERGMRKNIDEILNKLKKIWCDHNCQITADELLNHVPDVLVELDEEQKNAPSTASKKKKKRKW